MNERRRPQRIADASQRTVGPGADVAGQISVDRGRRGRSAIGHSRRRRDFSATRWPASIGGAICIFKPARRSTRSIIRAAALNEGSKLVIAAAGPAVRTLPTELPADLRVSAGRTAASDGVGLFAIRGFACRACWRSKAQNFRPRRATPAWRFERFCAAFGAGRRDQSVSAGGDRRRQRVRGRVAGEFSVGNVYAQQSGGRCLWHRRFHAAEALGLPRIAGDRRPDASRIMRRRWWKTRP